MDKNYLKKNTESKLSSSSAINLHSQPIFNIKNYQLRPKHSLDSQLQKQSLHAPLNYSHNAIKHPFKQKNITCNQQINTQNQQANNQIPFIYRQYSTQNLKNTQNLSQSQQSKNLQKYFVNEHSCNVQQSAIFQEAFHNRQPPHRSKSDRNLRNKNYKAINPTENQKNNTQNQISLIKQKNKNLNQNLQHKIIYENFRQSDLNFLSDQQLLPQGMHPQERQRKNSSKNNSRKSESNHPIFRQTLEYVDQRKYNFRDNLMGIDAQSQEISDQQSNSSIPLTNIDNRSSYKDKYRKYKQKYNNSIKIIKQFQKLNETLIQDQRQNFQYYENTIKDLENMLMIKDKEIDELNHLLRAQNQENYSQGLCSIDGRQLQMDNQRLKKQLQFKNQQINLLKEKLPQKLSQSMIKQQMTSGSIQNLQKKYDLLKKQNQSLSKKIKNLENFSKIYESKLKQKEQRLCKLSQFNSDLQQQIIKLKSKMHSDETYDTQRSFVQDFSKKNKKENLTFSTETFSKFPIIPQQKKIDSPYEIEKYITCIDQQLQLIRSSLTKQKGENGKNYQTASQFPKKQMSELDYVSEFQFDDQEQHKIPFKLLSNVVDKLTNFRASMGV